MTDCPFCRIVRGDADATRVYASDTALAFFDANPVAPYHTLVVPKRHATDVFDVSEADLLGVMAAVRHVARVYRERLGVEAVEVLSVSGAAAQQSVFHLHVHIVPRHTGDGLDTHWTTRPELRARFPDWLARLDA